MTKLNGQIDYAIIRLIDINKIDRGLVSIEEAIALAESECLDLVLLSEVAVPPICRIMDYTQYEIQMQERIRLRDIELTRIRSINRVR
jgi:translation initiation factor IF-3